MEERALGNSLTMRDFCTCTRTWRLFRDEIASPYPSSPESQVALEALARELLDPVIACFGRERFEMTYGFCSDDLRRHLLRKDPSTGRRYGRIDPRVDQHMAYERRPDGKLYCERPGAACDFRIRDLSSRDLVEWILERGLPFDSLYYYGPDRPIHLSHGAEHRRAVWAFTPTGVPTRKGIEDWVERAKNLRPR